ncbi:ER membrane complex subunit 3 [Kappamyces sp. JEL0829]|nr:ER membrane complex subunit 3 [Kappamyces sp. JEL0829]
MHLDPAIRDWVMFPILVVMILVGLLRSNATLLMNSKPKLDKAQMRETQALMRVLRQRVTRILHPSTHEYWKAHALEYMKERDASGDPMSNPEQLEGTMDMMKKNVLMIVPQTVIMSWVSYFFSGFVLTKLPFPLTLRFKQMLQAGIDTKDMDVSWVSSISWYFLLLFGLSSVYTLLMDDASNTSSAMDMTQMQGNPMAQQADVKKMFLNEIEFLELLDYEWGLQDVKERILEKYT